MKTSRLAVAAVAALLGACGGGDDETGTVALAFENVQGATFDATNDVDVYSVTLNAGAVNIVGANLVDGADEETEVVAADTALDLLGAAAVELGSIEVVPTDFAEIHVFPANAAAGELAGLTVSIDASITLTDGTVASALISLATEGGEEQQVTAPVSVAAGDDLTATLTFDAATLLGGIDFDGLAVDGVITVEAGTGDPNVDAALVTLEENLFLSFGFGGVE